MEELKLSDSAKNLKLGIYEHFKGMKVEVIGVAYDSENLNEIVVYKELRDGNLWTRPIQMFLEQVERDGNLISRFKYIGEKLK